MLEVWGGRTIYFLKCHCLGVNNSKNSQSVDPIPGVDFKHYKILASSGAYAASKFNSTGVNSFVLLKHNFNFSKIDWRVLPYHHYRQ